MTSTLTTAKKYKKPGKFKRVYFRDSMDSGLTYRADAWRGEGGVNEEWTEVSYFHQSREKWIVAGVTLSHGNGLRIESETASLDLDYGQAGDLRIALEAAHLCHGSRMFCTYTHNEVSVTRRKPRKSRKSSK